MGSTSLGEDEIYLDLVNEKAGSYFVVLMKMIADRWGDRIQVEALNE